MPSYTRDAVGPSSTAEARIGSADLVHLKGRDQAKVQEARKLLQACCGVRPAHVGSRDPDDSIRRLHDRWRGALFEAD